MTKKKLSVSRALLKKAVDNKNWDLLDKLLETDSTNINDTSMYTDTWGEWWGLLYHCVIKHQVTGIKILLKHGADKTIGNWGDCIVETPLEYAKERQMHEIVALLSSKETPTYTRQTKPKLPKLPAYDEKVNRQGQIRDSTGLVFQIPEDDE